MIARRVPLLGICLVFMTACAPQRPAAPAPAEQVDSLRSLARPVIGSDADYDDLVDLVGDHQFVLLGEATHGTREFYRERARLTRRLVEDKGFTVVLFEADWPDAYDVNEFIHGRGAATAGEALSTFTNFPRWMWGNTEIRALVDWLRTHNASDKGKRDPVGVYGMDLYSVRESMDDVVAFLEKEDPAAARQAAERYRCLRGYRGDMQRYGAEVASDTRGTCQGAVTAVFEEMSRRVAATGQGHRPGDDHLISAWQNARVVVNGEAYYRTIYAGGVASWNLRDRHMADTIDAVSRHLNEGAARPAKVIVWAHNSHLGDARVTERAEIGELNVGQLMRQRHDGRTVLVGFTTYEGRVRASSQWGAEDRDHALRPALPGSFSAVFHAMGIPAFSLRLRGNAAAAQALGPPRLERFVGVIYAPATERRSHYFEVDLARQYDAVVHIDRTTAVEPIPRIPR